MAKFRTGGLGGERVEANFSGEIEKYLKRYKRKGLNTKPVMLRFAQDMIRSTDRNFIAQGRKNGISRIWKKLAPSTIARRRKGKGSGKPQILQDTGLLRRSIWTRATKKRLTIGTSVPYARYHQQRGNWGGRSGHIPARPFLWFHQTDLKRFKQRLKEYLEETGGGKGKFKGV